MSFEDAIYCNGTDAEPINATPFDWPNKNGLRKADSRLAIDGRMDNKKRNHAWQFDGPVAD